MHLATPCRNRPTQQSGGQELSRQPATEPGLPGLQPQLLQVSPGLHAQEPSPKAPADGRMFGRGEPPQVAQPACWMFGSAVAVPSRTARAYAGITSGTGDWAWAAGPPSQPAARVARADQRPARARAGRRPRRARPVNGTRIFTANPP